MRHRDGRALTPDEYHTVTHASPDEYVAAADVIRAEAAAPRGARVVAAVFTIRGEAKVPTNPSSVRAMVIEVTKQTFNSDVVQRSRTTPVIVYLWAKWCGPCKQLGPVLEKLAAEAGGQWILAKVDGDANPQLSTALKVQEQKLPMVMAFVGGQLMKGFHGAMPEAQLRQWLSQVPATAEKKGLQADRELARDIAYISVYEPPAGPAEQLGTFPSVSGARTAVICDKRYISGSQLLAATVFAHESAAFGVPVLAGAGGDVRRGCRAGVGSGCAEEAGERGDRFEQQGVEAGLLVGGAAGVEFGDGAAVPGLGGELAGPGGHGGVFEGGRAAGCGAASRG